MLEGFQPFRRPFARTALKHYLFDEKSDETLDFTIAHAAPLISKKWCVSGARGRSGGGGAKIATGDLEVRIELHIVCCCVFFNVCLYVSRAHIFCKCDSTRSLKQTTYCVQKRSSTVF